MGHPCIAQATVKQFTIIHTKTTHTH